MIIEGKEGFYVGGGIPDEYQTSRQYFLPTQRQIKIFLTGVRGKWNKRVKWKYSNH